MRRLLTMTVAAGLLAGCAQGPDGSVAVGMVGSPAWQLTATEATKYATYQAACESYGYHPEDLRMPDCIAAEAREVNYEG